jgi:hypothetical protein
VDHKRLAASFVRGNYLFFFPSFAPYSKRKQPITKAKLNITHFIYIGYENFLPFLDRECFKFLFLFLVVFSDTVGRCDSPIVVFLTVKVFQ